MTRKEQEEMQAEYEKAKFFERQLRKQNEDPFAKSKKFQGMNRIIKKLLYSNDKQAALRREHER